jgi:hypothetical protein
MTVIIDTGKERLTFKFDDQSEAIEFAEMATETFKASDECPTCEVWVQFR